MLSKFPSFYRLILILVFLVLPVCSNAQEVQEKDQESSADTIQVEKPEVIPLDQIIGEIEKTNESIDNIREKINANETQIDSIFPIYEGFLNTQRENVERFFKANPNREKIDNLIIKWEGFENYLSRWESEINEIENRNSRYYENLEFEEATWKLNYDNALEKDLPLEVQNSIRSTWLELRVLKDSIAGENNILLELESRINRENKETSQIIERLKALKRSEVYQLFYQRIPPIWQSSFDNISEPSREENMNSLEITKVGILNFIDNNKSSLPLFLFLVALLALLVVYLKKAFEKYPLVEKDLDIQQASKVLLQNHLVTIFFLSLLLARYFFVPLPKLFLDINSLLLLLCSVPLWITFVDEKYRKLLYFAVFLYILNSVKTYAWFNAEQYRLYLLTETILILGILIAYTRPFRAKKKHEKWSLGWFLSILIPIAYLLGIVALVSNILGYVNLTDLSLKILSRSGVLLIWFNSLLMVLYSVFLSIIHRHYHAKEAVDIRKKFYTEKKVFRIIKSGLIFIWFLLFLKLIDQLEPLVAYVKDILEEVYTVGSTSFTLNDVFSFILILFISFLLTRIIAFLLNDEDGVLKSLKLPKGVPTAISIIIRYLIIAFGIVLALSSLGIDLSKFNLMAGALGLGIGFGLQTVISNFVSGLILVFERPIIKGDTVEVDKLLGTVNRIGIRSSNITTFDGAEVIVPNNNLISNDLINWTLSNNTKRVEIHVGTTYSSDPNEVLKVLFRVAEGHKYTLKQPPPQALFMDFGESSLNFTLRFWCHYENWLQAKSDISIGVYNAFKEANIQIPFPQRDIYIKSMPGSEEPKEDPDKKGPLARDIEDTDVPEVVVPIEHREPENENKKQGELDPSEDTGSRNEGGEAEA
ncbi:mechanosensitive ion channel-like protein [Christiangramia gaetbulicola]|uniref:Mechanosensitive ion channel-like protein n=1 Tax=Christiangramia gaetbulicola TaxID=703340 RepID=A0A2T6ALW2_9FLAO|nr:mechanosensitive ion channel domain-containing protein [Christiangramia gaetbulicola]PTX44814.1 mechanosensitive ion channel-like protein [Christiangramia gaetbulicola]